jgi:hypothetical protein
MIKRPQVVFKGMESSPGLEAEIARRIEQLEHAAPLVQSCRVVVDVPHRHQTNGRIYGVLVDVTLPGRQIVFDGARDFDGAHGDPYFAVRDAFAVVRRRVHDAARRDRALLRNAADAAV